MKGGRIYQRERMSHIRSPEWDCLLSIQRRRRRLKGGTALERFHTAAWWSGEGGGVAATKRMLFIDPANNRLSWGGAGQRKKEGGCHLWQEARGGRFMAEREDDEKRGKHLPSQEDREKTTNPTSLHLSSLISSAET